jgi:hypothetical protein
VNRSATDADLAAIDSLDRVDTQTKRLLKEVRISLETVYLSAEDREDVADSLRRLARELNKPEPDPDRLQRYWWRIDDLAPTAGHELARAEAIQQRSLRWGEGIRPKGGYLNEAAAREFADSVTDPHLRQVLERAHAAMVQLSLTEKVRPEGAFDLL